MTPETQYLLDHLQVRKSKMQKATFRSWLIEILLEAGYHPVVESGGSLIKSNNVVVGDPEQASVVFTAHYDTCAVLPFPNFITPQNLILYFLYQVLICIPMFVFAICAEILLLALWNDCPMWLAMLVVYFVLGFCIWWITAGPANKHTANDNTSGVATLLEIALTLPADNRNKVAFVFFDNEEKGLLGSSVFKKQHGNSLSNTPLINFDCVSDGEYIQFYPNKKAKQNRFLLSNLEKSFLSDNNKTVQIVRDFGFYPSDQRTFPLGIGVAALHKCRLGFWLGRIHTKRDTVYQEENIELLRRGALNFIDLF